ncbi:hypothetical protein [Sediminimonas sp.]|uniref:hypothetical protein n=1 Tax=Sediminimonas sp. TaxID=2823379 RepID=UPI0025FBB7D3|nr:hypothetical protein [Sediminimonas sp.]
MSFDQNVFINCPFDKEYAPILQAVLFATVLLGFKPRLATERHDSGETRLDKIRELIEESKYSIHDLSRCQASQKGEFFRLNMPFELGMDWGCRSYFGDRREEKRFLILEEKPFRFQAAISDLSGCDIETHGGKYDRAIKKVRYWLRQQTGCAAPGPSRLLTDYATFSEWEYETKMKQGYSEEDIKEYPTFERLEAMQEWVDAGRPAG